MCLAPGAITDPTGVIITFQALPGTQKPLAPPTGTAPPAVVPYHTPHTCRVVALRSPVASKALVLPAQGITGRQFQGAVNGPRGEPHGLSALLDLVYKVTTRGRSGRCGAACGMWVDPEIGVDEVMKVFQSC